MGRKKEKERKQAVDNWHHDEPIRDIRERGNQEQNWMIGGRINKVGPRTKPEQS